VLVALATLAVAVLSKLEGAQLAAVLTGSLTLAGLIARRR
jgi:hypothetical protein